MSELIEVKGYYQGTANITDFAAVYSVKNRKFIRGRRVGDRVSGEIIYRLYPSTYIMFEYSMWSKDDPPRKITVAMFRLTPDGKKEWEGGITIRFYNPNFLDQFPEQIRDFFASRPRYHSPPALDTEKVYNEKEHEKLLEILKKGGVFEEGGEHE